MAFKDLAELEKALSEHTNLNVNEYALINKRMDEVIDAIRENTAKSAEMLLLYDNLKSAFRIFGWLESFATFLVKIGGAAGIAWAVWKYGVMASIENVKVPK